MVRALGVSAVPAETPWEAYVDGCEVYTAQLHLPEYYNEIIEKRPPYNQHPGLERLPNDQDVGW